MNIILDYQPDVASAPAGFEADIEDAASILDDAITNQITVTIQISYQPLSGSTLADASATFAGFEPTYTQLVGYLTAAAKADPTPATTTMLADLPPDPTGAGTFLISNAQEKAWGLLPAGSSEEDGFANFNSAFDWSATGTPGTYDLVAVAEHELTHALGRISLNGAATAMNLVSYGTNGQLDLTASDPRYFSVDGGKTPLASFDTGDPADFAAGSPLDPFDEYINAGTTPTWSSLDSEVMNVLGFSVPAATPPPAPPPPPPAPPPQAPSTISDVTTGTYNATNAVPGDTFKLDGAGSYLDVGLSSSTVWAFGYNEIVGVQGGASTVTDWGQDMHLIVGDDAVVTAIAIAGATARDAGWTVQELGVTAAQLQASIRSDGHGGTMVGIDGTSVDIRNLVASGPDAPLAGHLL